MSAQEEMDREAARTEVESTVPEHWIEEGLANDPSATIYQRMARILAELPAIGKTEYNEQQRFHFRGIDQVLNALNPLLAKHGVFVVPEVLERVAQIRTTGGGKAMYEVNLRVAYRFYGLAGDHVEASGWGEGTDLGDKATNKAMTGALKYVLFQAFSISTEEASDQDAAPVEDTTVSASGGERAAVKGPKDMPKNYSEIHAWMEGGYNHPAWVDFQVFMQDAAEAIYGKREGLAEEQKSRMGLLTARAVGFLFELWPPGGQVPPNRQQMQVAWDKALKGVPEYDARDRILEGPPHRMGPDEMDRPERGAESAFRAPGANGGAEGSPEAQTA